MPDKIDIQRWLSLHRSSTIVNENQTETHMLVYKSAYSAAHNVKFHIIWYDSYYWGYYAFGDVIRCQYRIKILPFFSALPMHISNLRGSLLKISDVKYFFYFFFFRFTRTDTCKYMHMELLSVKALSLFLTWKLDSLVGLNFQNLVTIYNLQTQLLKQGLTGNPQALWKLDLLQIILLQSKPTEHFQVSRGLWLISLS